MFTRLILLLAFLRIGLLFFRGLEFADFHMFYDSATLLKEGLNPYSPEILKLYGTRGYPESVLPIVFPTLSFLFYPFTWFSFDVALFLFFLINVIALVILFIGSWKQTESPYEERFAFSFLLFANALPVTLSLGMGQVSIIVTCLLAALFFIKAPQGILLGIATVIKYSLTPLYALLLPIRSILIAATIFLLVALLPSLFGHDLRDLYSDYMAIMHEAFTSGENLYRNGGGYNMVNLDFFQDPILNVLGKLPFILGFFLMMYHQRSFSFLSLLLLTSCITLLITYHRIYDAVFVVLLLLIFANRFYVEKKWLQVGILSVFLTYFSLPQGILLPWLNHVGSLLGEQSWIYLGTFREYSTIFPLPAMIMLLLSLYSFYLCFQEKKHA